MPINYFGLIISAFPSAFFLLLSPARDPHQLQLQLQLLGAKAMPKAGLLFAGLCHLRSGRPGISPCHSRAASTGSTLPPCLHPSRAACTPEPKWWGATMSSLEQTGAARGGGAWSKAWRGVCQGPSAALVVLPAQGRQGRRAKMVSHRLSHASHKLSRCAHAGRGCSVAAGVLHYKRAGCCASPGLQGHGDKPQHACPTQHRCC